MVDIEISGALPSGVEFELLEKLATEACAVLGVRQEVRIALSIVDDAAIRELNRQFRAINKVTDVLSFGYDKRRRMPVGQAVALGDVVIARGRARRQAKSVGRTYAAEFTLLWVHGVLHLLGMDHVTLAQEKKMFALQHELLDRSGVI